MASDGLAAYDRVLERRRAVALLPLIDAREREGGVGPKIPGAPPDLGSNGISLPKPRESTAKSEDLRGGEEELQQPNLQGFFIHAPDFAHNSGR
jgi:hypothetical protein